MEKTLEHTLEEALNLGLPTHFGLSFKAPPEVLYHYTTLQGLIGIVSTRRIWATNNRYLNDTSEAKQLWLALEKRLEIFSREGRKYPEINLADLTKMVREKPSDDYFVASFSEARDSLSQWRAYAVNGPGVCIGFDSRALNTSWIYNPRGEPHWTGQQFQKNHVRVRRW